MTRYLLTALLMCILATAAAAQTNTDNSLVVTEDKVNTLASKMYCPVCENIPLDDCGTAACNDWRSEIRVMMENGDSDAQIIDNFVTRYGDRVVGIPQNSTLRALSLWTPALLIVLGIIALGVFAVQREENGHILDSAVDDAPTADDWRAQIERDVQGVT